MKSRIKKNEINILKYDFKLETARIEMFDALHR